MFFSGQVKEEGLLETVVGKKGGSAGGRGELLDVYGSLHRRLLAMTSWMCMDCFVVDSSQ